MLFCSVGFIPQFLVKNHFDSSFFFQSSFLFQQPTRWGLVWTIWHLCRGPHNKQILTKVCFYILLVNLFLDLPIFSNMSSQTVSNHDLITRTMKPIRRFLCIFVSQNLCFVVSIGYITKAYSLTPKVEKENKKKWDNFNLHNQLYTMKIKGVKRKMEKYVL